MMTIFQSWWPISDSQKGAAIQFEEADVDTVAGLLVHQAERLLVAGDVIELPGVTAKVLSVSDDRATKVRFTLSPPKD